MLVLVEFGGPPRTRLARLRSGSPASAPCSSRSGRCAPATPWLAAAAMAVVGFGTLFSGLFSGYFAAAATAALLTFVLPVTIPAPNSAIPDRLEGWGLATGAAICAVMLLWPPRRRADLQRDGGRARCAPSRTSWMRAPSARRRAAVARARRSTVWAGASSARSTGRPGRPDRRPRWRRFPTSSTGCSRSSRRRPSCRRSSSPARRTREAIAATAAVLRASADRLEGRDERPDFARLDAARDAVARALVQRLPTLPADTRDDTLLDALEPPFRIRVVDVLGAPGRRLRAARDRRGRNRARPTRDLAQPRPARARSKRRSSSRSSTRASARSGSRTASAAPPGSRSPSSSRSGPACSTGSGSCSARSRCSARTRSAPAGRSSARSRAPRSGSSSARCS